MIVKYRHRLWGGHVHVRVFAGENPDALGLTGTLIFREKEWETFKKWTQIADTAMMMTRAAQAGGVDVRTYFVDDTGRDEMSAIEKVLDI